MVKEYDKAAADITKAISLHDGESELYHWRGIVYREGGKLDRALADFSTAIELGGDRAYSYCGRGKTYKLLERHEENIADQTKALELQDDFPYLYYERACSFQALGKDVKAGEDLQRARALIGNDEEKHADLLTLLAELEELLQGGTAGEVLGSKALSQNRISAFFPVLWSSIPAACL
jgi:tetratricopeptide (TPR) repeat protein